MSALVYSTSNPHMTLDSDPKRLLDVPQVLNDSTTLLQKPPTEGSMCFKAILTTESSTNKDQLQKSANISFDGDDWGQSGYVKQKKFTLVTVPSSDDIFKTAVITDVVEDVSDDDSDAEEGIMDDVFIALKLFHLKHGYKKEEFERHDQKLDNTLNAVQELRLIHHPYTENFETLVEQLQAMGIAATAVQLDDVALFEAAVGKCERVFEHHQKFDKILESEPNQPEVVRALYEMVRNCYKETSELIEDWAVVSYTLQDLIQHLSAITTATTNAIAGSNGKSPKSRRSLFSKKSAETALPQLTPEVLQHQKDVCINWAAQMRAFEQLARAYRAFAEQVTEFALIREVEALGQYCGEEIWATFEKAQVEFQNTKQLSQLHHQIDYTNFNKVLSKENALTTAEERMASPPRPLFSREMIGQIRLVREGRLTEFVSPFAAAAASNKRKSVTPAVPKAYQLIVASDMIYLCEIVNMPTESKKSGGVHKLLRLVHEPVLVIDSQISSTPDIVHPPLVQKNMVMVCFYNQTSYILQADSCEERDAWVECARKLDIEQPKASEACREQDEHDEIQRSMSSASFATIGQKSKSSKMSLLKRLKTLRRPNNILAEDMGPIPEIDPDQLTRTDEEEKARRMQLGQPSLWEVRRLPLDLGVIPPLEHPIPFRKSHLYDSNVKIVDLTTGKVAPGEFGMGIEDRAAYFRDECALFAVLRPGRLIPFNDIDRQRDDFFLCCKRLHKGEVMYVEPPYITDFYARSWLHPDMHIEFDAENKSVMIAKMYRIICSTMEIVIEFQKYHSWLIRTARISPDNTFLCMDYRSQPLRISKRIERAATLTGNASTTVEDSKVLEAGRKYTELGECNIEFRRMSNAPDALSVGFYNPGTKRDMAVGVMVFDKSKVKATASSLGLNAMRMLGPSNGIVRVSPTEMSLTLWQTDARTRPTFIKGQRVFETVKSKSLDMFKISGQRDALDELEDFMRVKSGTDCKARELRETFKLVKMAFRDEVIDAPMEDDYEASQRQVLQADDFFGYRGDGLLETVPEEDEDEDEEGEVEGEDKEGDEKSIEEECEYQRKRYISEELAGSSETFRLKSRSALLRMEKNQKERAAAEARAKRAIGTQLPPIASSSFDDLASDGALSSFMTESKAEVEEITPPSVADLTSFWAKATSAAIVRSLSSTSLKSSVLSRSPSSASLSPPENDCSSGIASSLPLDHVKNTPEKVSEGGVDPVAATTITTTTTTATSTTTSTITTTTTAESGTELAARVSVVKAGALRSAIVLQTVESTSVEVNDQGVVQATRYLPKKIPNAEGIVVDDKNEDIEPGVDSEHHMPVKDLTRRWEEMTRMGI